MIVLIQVVRAHADGSHVCLDGAPQNTNRFDKKRLAAPALR